MIATMISLVLAIFLAISPYHSTEAQLFSLNNAANANVSLPIVKRTWEEASNLASTFVSQLNLTEKASIVTGNVVGACDGNIIAIPRLNFSGLCLHDGPLGIRVADLASIFPAGVSVGATWDRDLMYARGFAMGQEFRGKGAHVALGPVAGPLGRHPLGGRNWEGFAVDPYLSGVAMNATIYGHQDAGVQTCTKHYIGNEQETLRTLTVINGTNVQALSANIDDRTLHELYLWPFADAVKAGTASIMCSYNRLNLTYSCESDESLNRVLKQELGFQGYVMSDWFATHSGVNSIMAGLDMTMPGPLDQETAMALDLSAPPELVPSYFGGNLTAAVKNGTLAESRVDDMVRRIMTPYYYLRQDQGFPSVDPSNEYVTYLTYGQPIDTSAVPQARDVRGDHASLIRTIAAASTVLLKNEHSFLPVKQPRNVAVFGNAAPDTTDGLYFLGDTTRPNDRPLGAEIGPLATGGGSGSGRTSDLVSPLRAIRDRGIRDGFRTQYITNNYYLSRGILNSIFPIPDICFVFLKTFASEAWDRLSFENDWNSTLVVQSVANSLYCSNKTVVITESAGVNTLPWADNVTAILASHYPGEQAGNSIMDVLWGDVNPSGHLTYTIPKQGIDYGFPIVNITGPEAVDSNAWQTNYTEGLYIDYRHFDANNITPRYEFGYGLSYTTFELSSTVTVSKENIVSSAPAPVNSAFPGGNPDLWNVILKVTTTVNNTGAVAGAAVPQLYVSLPAGTVCGAPPGTPVKALRGFDKVYLEPGQTANVEFSLMRRDVSFWSVEEQQWRIPEGDITFSIGFSSRDIKAQTSVTLVQRS